MNTKEIVKGNIARFSHYRSGNLYYEVISSETDKPICLVPVDIFNKDDIGNAKYESEIKAISIMRYINLAKKEESIAYY